MHLGKSGGAASHHVSASQHGRTADYGRTNNLLGPDEQPTMTGRVARLSNRLGEESPDWFNNQLQPVGWPCSRGRTGDPSLDRLQVSNLLGGCSRPGERLRQVLLTIRMTRPLSAGPAQSLSTDWGRLLLANPAASRVRNLAAQ